MVSSSTGRVSGHNLARMLGEWSRGFRPSAEALRSALRGLVLDGRLPAGTRLPAEREFAEATGVSRNLVGSALERLRADGFVTSHRGAGSWVALPASGTMPSPGDWSPRDRTGPINLAQATPAAPVELFDAIERARERIGGEVAGHGYLPQGLPALRRRIAETFTGRGLATTPEQILVTSGAQHAFALVLRMLISPGERVMVEHPTYPNALEAIRSGHGLPLPVPVSGQGWDAELFEASLAQGSPKLAYLIPDFQNPTGAHMDAQHRQRLATALRRTRTTAVVDETLVDIDLSGRTPPPPFASFGEEHVITTGSASKSFWGGLRLGWVRASEEFVRRMVTGRAAVDLGSPVLEQLVLDELLAHAEPVLRARREETALRRDELVASLRKNRPLWRFTIPAGGLGLWCDLGRPAGGRLVDAAEKHGLRMVSGTRFAAQGTLDRHVRLPYTLPAETLREAVAKLALAEDALGVETAVTREERIVM